MRVARKSYRTWEVSSETKAKTTYTVWFNGKWHCTCQGFRVHMQGCKHIRAVLESLRNEKDEEK